MIVFQSPSGNNGVDILKEKSVRVPFCGHRDAIAGLTLNPEAIQSPLFLATVALITWRVKDWMGKCCPTGL